MYIAPRNSWYLERTVYLIAGLFTLGSVSLAYFVHPNWLILTAFVGVNLVIFAFSGFCIMANILHALGFRSIRKCEG